MSTKYLLEDEREAARLERMSRLAAYQPATELVHVTFKPGFRVLDAGCGSGLVARHIASQHPEVQVEGCDLSPVRVQQAQEIDQAGPCKNKVRFFASPLESINAPDNHYDRITCRFVFQFLEDPVRVAREFRRILKPGGQALIIDFDGFLFNYFHKNPELAEMLDFLEKKGPFDMFRARSLPSMMMDTGFKEVDWDIIAYGFKGDQLVGEKEQMYDRINYSIPTLAKVFGSEAKATRFRDLYSQELLSQGSVLFYNKFLVRGRKPE